MLVVGAPMVSWGRIRRVERRCVALAWVMRWISRSFCFDKLKVGKGRGGGEAIFEQYFVAPVGASVERESKCWLSEHP